MALITHLVAMSNNRVIGVNNDLPWKLSADLKHFKEYTIGKPILMGRKTFESIGRPLPQRVNVVISRSISNIDGAHVFNKIDEGIKFAQEYNKKNKLNDEVIVIGGAQIFLETISKIDKLVLTKVDCNIEGDVFYPEINLSSYLKKNILNHTKDTENQYNFTIDEYERI